MIRPRQLLEFLSRDRLWKQADINRYEALLIENWFDSEATLRGATVQALERLGLPLDVATAIEEAVKAPEKRNQEAIPRENAKVSASEVASPFQKNAPPKVDEKSAMLSHLANFAGSLVPEQRQAQSLLFLRKALSETVAVGEEAFLRLLGGRDPDAKRLVWSDKHLSRLISFIWPCKSVQKGSNEQQVFIQLVNSLLDAIEQLLPVKQASFPPPATKSDYRQIWMDILAKTEGEFSMLYSPRARLVDHARQHEFELGDRRQHSENGLKMLIASFDRFKRNFAAQIEADDSLNSETWKIEAILKQQKVNVRVIVRENLALQVLLSKISTLDDFIGFLRQKLSNQKAVFWLRNRQSGECFGDGMEGVLWTLQEAGMADGTVFDMLFADAAEGKAASVFKIQDIF